ncbi:MAG: Rieske (2Fe-2S) protein [Halobacteriaceae archaeon]
MPDRERICAFADVPEADSLLFRVRERRERDDGPSRADGGVGADGPVHEAILLRTDAGGDGGEGGGDLVAWRNHCQHFTDVRLDRGDGVVRRGAEIVCANHGAYFEADSGLCTHGPCEGAVLEPVDVAVADGSAVLADERYRLVGLGGRERDPLDRSTTGEREL